MKIDKNGFIVFEDDNEWNLYRLGYIQAIFERKKYFKLMEKNLRRKFGQIIKSNREERERIDKSMREDVKLKKFFEDLDKRVKKF